MSKKQSAKEKTLELISKFSNNYLVVKDLIALTFFSIAFSIFFFFATGEGDIVKVLVVLYGLIVLFLCHALIIEYVLKTIALQNNENIKRFTAILAINTGVGLIIPIWIMNQVLGSIIYLMDNMSRTGSLLCEIRRTVVGYYYTFEVYYMLHNLTWMLLIATLMLFIFGGVVERYLKK